MSVGEREVKSSLDEMARPRYAVCRQLSFADEFSQAPVVYA
jgi:hypothetical protein